MFPVAVAEQAAEAQQADDRGRGSRRFGGVVQLAGAHDQVGLAAGGVVERAARRGELLHDGVGQLAGELQRPQLAAAVVQLQKAADQVRVVGQAGGVARFAGPVAAQQPPVAQQFAAREAGGGGGGGDEAVAPEHPPGHGQRVDCQPVPGRDDLVVQQGPRAPVARRQQRVPPAPRQRPLAARPIQDIAAAELALRVGDGIALLGEAVSRDHLLDLRRCGAGGPQRGAHVIDLPQVERAFHLVFRLLRVARGVGVLGRVEAALRRLQVVQQVIEGGSRDGRAGRVAGDLVGGGVGAGELRLVVQHLLEVRDPPEAVHAVTVEAAAQVVVHAAARHRVQRHPRHLQGALARGAPIVLQQRREHHRTRELRRRAETAVAGIEGLRQPVGDGRQQFGRGGLRRRSRQRDRAAGHLAHGGGDARRGGFHLGAALAPAPGQKQQQFPERRPPVHRPRREVGAGVERLPLRGKEHRHRPAAGAGDRLHHAHVDAVHVRPLLTVDLDVDEVLVHHRRDRLVLERLVLHHVAPVAGGVADRHEQRLVGGGRRGERLVAPRIPVDRVVGVLQQVGAAFVEQAVGPATRGAPAGQ